MNMINIPVQRQNDSKPSWDHGGRDIYYYEKAFPGNKHLQDAMKNFIFVCSVSKIKLLHRTGSQGLEYRRNTKYNSTTFSSSFFFANLFCYLFILCYWEVGLSQVNDHRRQTRNSSLLATWPNSAARWWCQQIYNLNVLRGMRTLDCLLIFISNFSSFKLLLPQAWLLIFISIHCSNELFTSLQTQLISTPLNCCCRRNVGNHWRCKCSL